MSVCVLSDSEIIRAVYEKRIVINPFDDSMVGPNSVDLRVGNVLMTHVIHPSRPYIDPREPPVMMKHDVPEGGMVLMPGECYLGSTIEIAGSNYYVPQIETRSSWARSTLSSHASAGWGDVAFVRTWVLEITVTKPVLLRPEDSICQVIFTTVQGTVMRPYGVNGGYADQDGVTPSRYHRFFVASDKQG